MRDRWSKSSINWINEYLDQCLHHYQSTGILTMMLISGNRWDPLFLFGSYFKKWTSHQRERKLDYTLSQFLLDCKSRVDCNVSNEEVFTGLVFTHLLIFYSKNPQINQTQFHNRAHWHGKCIGFYFLSLATAAFYICTFSILFLNVLRTLLWSINIFWFVCTLHTYIHTCDPWNLPLLRTCLSSQYVQSRGIVRTSLYLSQDISPEPC